MEQYRNVRTLDRIEITDKVEKERGIVPSPNEVTTNAEKFEICAGRVSRWGFG
jgi:hypothetical protein